MLKEAATLSLGLTVGNPAPIKTYPADWTSVDVVKTDVLAIIDAQDGRDALQKLKAIEELFR